MAVLTDAQKSAFRESGWLLLPDAVTPAQLAALRADMDAWTQASREHASNYGLTINERPRFDLDPTHAPDHPALRRINAPIEVSAAHFEVATDSRCGATGGSPASSTRRWNARRARAPRWSPVRPDRCA